ncbi:hypothetical protein [Methylobacterium sp. WL64]|uniref:hypothetical protein n=1 Tax=Methylobacterium sp. WL64 TaxID=2603894 RepID=UPI00164FFC15|nr:hypothetical protein [Methylobacterium sp. WL64]
MMANGRWLDAIGFDAQEGSVAVPDEIYSGEWVFARITSALEWAATGVPAA